MDRQPHRSSCPPQFVFWFVDKYSVWIVPERGPQGRQTERMPTSDLCNQALQHQNSACIFHSVDSKRLSLAIPIFFRIFVRYSAHVNLIMLYIMHIPLVAVGLWQFFQNELTYLHRDDTAHSERFDWNKTFPLFDISWYPVSWASWTFWCVLGWKSDLCFASWNWQVSWHWEIAGIYTHP